MTFPIKTCVVCSEEFELHPGKPGFANRCPACSAPEETDSLEKNHRAAGVVGPAAAVHKADKELNEARRRTIRDMLYRKES
jgi:hypothetical protein